MPLLAGLAAAAITGNGIRDVRDLVPSPHDHHPSLEWGIYLALVGSASLALSLVPVLVDARRPRARKAPAKHRPKPMTDEEFVHLAQAYTPYVIRDEPRLIVPTGDLRLSRLFWRRTNDEQVLVRALAHLDEAGIAVRGTTFVDVGANIGQTTLAALRAGFGSAVAIEPVVETFQLLRANLALNGLDDRVETLQLALSDRPGTETLVLTPGKLGSSRVPMEAGESSQKPRTSVTVARLDDLVADGTVDPGSIGLLWIDTEGHEASVLRGAEKTLAAGFPVVAEINPGLAGAGALEDVAARLSERYTRVVDLRDRGALVLPADELDGLVAKLRRTRRVTDILAF